MSSGFPGYMGDAKFYREEANVRVLPFAHQFFFSMFTHLREEIKKGRGIPPPHLFCGG